VHQTFLELQERQKLQQVLLILVHQADLQVLEYLVFQDYRVLQKVLEVLQNLEVHYFH
jgi:hypothetical protein